MSEQSYTLNQLIIELYLSPKDVLPLDDATWTCVIRVLRHQQLLARYFYVFEKHDVTQLVSAYAKHHLLNAVVLADKQHKQVEYEAEALVNLASGKSQYLIFLKGASYVLSNDDASKGRTFSDIDLLVEKEAISTLEQRLNFMCWMPQAHSEYDDHYYRKWAHEIPPLRNSARGTVLDLHHNLVPVVSGRAPDIELFFASVTKTNNGIMVLSPPAKVLHSLIHLFFNEDFTHGYRDLLDIDLLINQHGNDAFWDALTVLANKTGFEKELFLCCRYLSIILQTNIPANLLDIKRHYSRLQLRYLDFVFSKTLRPNHPIAHIPRSNLACFLAFVRGHLLKMPFHILLIHTSNKAYRGTAKFLFGDAFFEKENDKK